MVGRVVACVIVAILLAAAAARPRPSVPRLNRPAVLTLRGGADQPTITIRVRSKSSTIRVLMPASATLADLQRVLQMDHKLPIAQQRLFRAPGGQQSLNTDADGDKSLNDLSITHGTMLHLELEPDAKRLAAAVTTAVPKAVDPVEAETAAAETAGAAAAPSAPTPLRVQGRRPRSTTMADHLEARAANEVLLESPVASKCTTYMAVSPEAAKRFVDWLTERDFSKRRIAMLFGRWAVLSSPASGKKRGYVAQKCSSTP